MSRFTNSAPKVALLTLLGSFASACGVVPNPFGGSNAHRQDPLPPRTTPAPQMPVSMTPQQPTTTPTFGPPTTPTPSTPSSTPPSTTPAPMDPQIIIDEQNFLNADPAGGRVLAFDPEFNVGPNQTRPATELVNDIASALAGLPLADGNSDERATEIGYLTDDIRYDLQSMGRPSGLANAEAVAEYQVNQLVYAGGGIAEASEANVTGALVPGEARTEAGVCAGIPAIGQPLLGDSLNNYFALTPSAIQDMNDADGGGKWDVGHEAGGHCEDSNIGPQPGETAMMTAHRVESTADIAMWLKRIQDNEPDILRKMKAFAAWRDISEVLAPQDKWAHASGFAMQALIDEYNAPPTAGDPLTLAQKVAGKTASQLGAMAHDRAASQLAKDFASTVDLNDVLNYAYNRIYSSGPSQKVTLPRALDAPALAWLQRFATSIENYTTLGKDNGLTWGIQNELKTAFPAAFGMAYMEHTPGTDVDFTARVNKIAANMGLRGKVESALAGQPPKPPAGPSPA